MKLRKNEIKVPKNFSFAPWQIKKSSEEILHFFEAVILFANSGTFAVGKGSITIEMLTLRPP